MSIRGKYPYYIVDTIAERDSLINVDFPERIECLVTNSAGTPPLSQLFTYASGSWLLIGGEIVSELFELSGQAGKYAKVKGDESGYEFAALAGGGDMVGANNLSDVTNPVTALSNIGGQPLDADLTAFAALNSATAGVPASIGAGWIQRTYAQLKTLLSLVASDVGLGLVDNTSDLAKPVSTAQQTALDLKVDTVSGKGLSKNDYVDADKAKVDFISITQPVDLDAIESRVNELDAAVILKGTTDLAAAGVFPGAGVAQAGWSYIITGSDITLDGIDFKSGDRVIAVTDNASTTVYAGNWFKADYTDAVLSVNGLTGAVTLTTANVADSTNKRYVTDAHLTILGNTSGTNSGNETPATLGTTVSGATDEPAPQDTDLLPLADASASFIFRKLTWLNIKTVLKAYFDTVYPAGSGNSTGTNTGDETGARIATLHHAASVKSALVDADEITGGNSASSFSLIRTTWTNVKAFLKTYFDTLYQAVLVSATNIKTINGSSILGSGDLTVSFSFTGIANIYSASFSVPANSGLPIVGYITMSGNTFVTIPSTSNLLMMN